MKMITTFLFLFFTPNIIAQPNYRNVSLAKALSMANTEGKMIFMQFESEDCKQCNEVADKGLDNDEVINRIDEAFIAIKMDPQHSDRKEITEKYNIKSFGSLFLDMNGTLIYSYRKSTTFSKEYLKQIDLALYSTSESARINDLEKEYTNGNRNIDFLELLLTKKKTLNLPTDVLLDEYVSVLPNDSLTSFRTLAFIARFAPMLDSKASYVLRKDRSLFNQVWYSMDLSLRIRINNVIISKGINKAISQKNEALAIRVATFAKSTHNTSNAGMKAYDENMLYFFENADTSKYFAKAIEYYGQYFMKVNTDSRKRIDTFSRRKSENFSLKRDTIIDGKKAMISTVSYAPKTQYFTSELNYAAISFYKMTNNPYLLSVATDWVKKGLEFYRSPEILDTYAKLLYRQNQKAKAIEIQAESIELRRQRKFPTKDYEMVLEKMKKNLDID